MNCACALRRGVSAACPPAGLEALLAAAVVAEAVAATGATMAEGTAAGGGGAQLSPKP